MRKRRETQQPADASAETTRRDEDEAPYSRRALEQQHLRDSAAERVTDDVRLFDSHGFEPSSHDSCVPVELIADIRPLGPSVPRQIGHQHAAVRRQQWRDLRPRKAGVVETVKKYDWRRQGSPTGFGPIKTNAFN